MTVEARPGGRFKHWLLAERIEQVEGPETRESKGRQQSWWKVVCLTGVDYFSTLGYIPGIAALAAGALSPIATLLIVALTLLAMVPMYRRVAEESPHGQGSIAILERLLSFWPGKLTVLVLLGFIATDFMITITLSASDAAVHLAENPLVHGLLGDQNLLITLLLVAVLGAIFLKGFSEAINLAVVIVGAYLLLNLVVVAVGLYLALTNPASIANWTASLFANYGNPLVMVGVAFLLFPKLALGISGFETGVSVMPLVRGDPEDDPEHPAGRDALGPLERQLLEGDRGLRVGHPHFPLYVGGEHIRAPRRHQDRLFLHSRHSHRLASFPGAALARASSGAHRAG